MQTQQRVKPVSQDRPPHVTAFKLFRFRLQVKKKEDKVTHRLLSSKLDFRFQLISERCFTSHPRAEASNPPWISYFWPMTKCQSWFYWWHVLYYTVFTLVFLKYLFCFFNLISFCGPPNKMKMAAETFNTFEFWDPCPRGRRLRTST